MGLIPKNYPKLQASLGDQPENTHGIQTRTQPISYSNFGMGSGITLEY